MKQQWTYDKVAEVLREVKPSLRQPEELTDQIMDRLQRHQTPDRRGINISDNAGRWNIFIGFRAVAAVTAVLLVGYFALQQWEMRLKISQLEEEVNNQKNTTLNFDQVEVLKDSYFKTLLNRQIKLKRADLKAIKSGKELFELNEASIDQLIQELERLDEENKQLKAAVLHQFVDTLRKYRDNHLKFKLL